MKNEPVTVHCTKTEEDFVSVGAIDYTGEVEIEMRTEDGIRVCWIRAGDDLDSLIKHLKKQRKAHKKYLRSQEG